MITPAKIGCSLLMGLLFVMTGAFTLACRKNSRSSTFRAHCKILSPATHTSKSRRTCYPSSPVSTSFRSYSTRYSGFVLFAESPEKDTGNGDDVKKILRDVGFVRGIEEEEKELREAGKEVDSNSPYGLFSSFTEIDVDEDTEEEIRKQLTENMPSELDIREFTSLLLPTFSTVISQTTIN